MTIITFSALISQCNVGYISEDGVDAVVMVRFAKDSESVWLDGEKTPMRIASVEMSYHFVHGENTDEGY